ncbi:hypothetical protein [Thermovenabulum sp.]|uniref:hypothetical protein n=1 Tax=Thermovenabulum sp. TaxID=3100335 RepID=UPI003C7E7300
MKDKPNFDFDMAQGLPVGLPVETVIEYTAKTKESIVSPFLEEISYRIKAGESFEYVLPYIVLVVYPLIANIIQFFSTA